MNGKFLIFKIFAVLSNDFSGFYVIVEGKAKCVLPQGEYSVYGKETYLKSKTFLMGGEKSPPSLIPGGTLTFNFSCNLPSLLPESLVVSHGSIEYKVQLVLDLTVLKNKEISFPFTVERSTDLSFFAGITKPFEVETTKSFFLFLKSQSCKVAITLANGTKYTQNESIPIRILYKNQSIVSIDRTRVRLKRYITYTTAGNYKEKESENISELYVDGVRRGENNIVDFNLNISAAQYKSNEDFCKIVTVSFVLKFECILNFLYSNIKLEIPVTIL